MLQKDSLSLRQKHFPELLWYNLFLSIFTMAVVIMLFVPYKIVLPYLFSVYEKTFQLH